jgi:hypothetical protein
MTALELAARDIARDSEPRADRVARPSRQGGRVAKRQDAAPSAIHCLAGLRLRVGS